MTQIDLDPQTTVPENVTERLRLADRLIVIGGLKSQPDRLRLRIWNPRDAGPYYRTASVIRFRGTSKVVEAGPARGQLAAKPTPSSALSDLPLEAG